jgi:prolyl-tRNA synthetase
MPVEADTGAIGGKFSHEFMVPAETGENEVVYCEKGDYAANVEKAISGRKPGAPATLSGAVEKFPTPAVLTIEALSKAPYNVSAQSQIKTLVYLVESKVVLVLICGDDQANEAKLTAAFGTANFRAATPEEIFEALGAHPGSLGGVGVVKHPVYADELLRGAANMFTGANEDGFHLRNVSIDRDVKVSKWVDVRTVCAGEPCPNCDQPLRIQRAIEVGHVFKLGTKYSESLNALFLDESGKQQPAIMGCYGIGITRTLQAVIEQCNDKDGIIWPISVAPYTVCITPLGVAPGSATMTLAEKLYAELSAKGIDVIIDDRDERPGVKFKDSELIGFPIRIGIGEKSLAKGEVELKIRGGELMPAKPEAVIAKVEEVLRSRA